MDLDRRDFLRKAGMLVVATSMGRIALDVFTPLGQSARAVSLPLAGPLPAGVPILVLIDLQGGNDAANMLINPSDPWYYDAARGHGNIAIKQSTILPLAGTAYGLHPSLVWLASRWANNGDLAFVHGSGENAGAGWAATTTSWRRPRRSRPSRSMASSRRSSGRRHPS